MNNTFASIALLMASLLFAQFAGAEIAPDLIDAQSPGKILAIEHGLQNAIKAKTGATKVRDFVMDWINDSQCIAMNSQQTENALVGTCVVGFVSRNIEGKAAVVFKDDGFSTQVLTFSYVD
jgi:hypothetical protein